MRVSVTTGGTTEGGGVSGAGDDSEGDATTVDSTISGACVRAGAAGAGGVSALRSTLPASNDSAGFSATGSCIRATTGATIGSGIGSGSGAAAGTSGAGATGAWMMVTGVNSTGLDGSSGLANGANCSSRNSAVILSRVLDGTLAAAMPRSFALLSTNLLSRFSFLAIS